MKAFIKHINLSLKKFEKKYYTRRLENYQNGIKKSWDVIKRIIGKAKSAKSSFPKKNDYRWSRNI